MYPQQHQKSFALGENIQKDLAASSASLHVQHAMTTQTQTAHLAYQDTTM
jgi:hypothetical protein